MTSEDVQMASAESDMATTASSSCAVCHQAGSTLRCSRCQDTMYCSSDCQNTAWPTHKLTCIPPPTNGLKISFISVDPPESAFNTGEGLGRHFTPIVVEGTHRIHNEGKISPISKIVKVPLLVLENEEADEEVVGKGKGKAKAKPQLGESDTNRFAGVLMTTKDGKVTDRWSQHPGSITVIRKDRKDLTKEALEMIWMFLDHVLEVWQVDCLRARELLNTTSFERFCKHYRKDQTLNGFSRFNTVPLPL